MTYTTLSTLWELLIQRKLTRINEQNKSELASGIPVPPRVLERVPILMALLNYSRENQNVQGYDVTDSLKHWTSAILIHKILEDVAAICIPAPAAHAQTRQAQWKILFEYSCRERIRRQLRLWLQHTTLKMRRRFPSDLLQSSRSFYHVLLKIYVKS